MDRYERLRAMDEGDLAALLRRRPDVLVGRAPRTLRELGDRLDSFASVSAACVALNAPQLQVLVAAAAVGAVTTFRLAELLEGDPRPVLADLAALDLLHLEDDDVHMTPEVRRAVPDLLTMGHPFNDLAMIHSHRTLRGRITERIVRPHDLDDDRIEAWCELRGDDREFLLGSILGVRAV